MWAAKVKYMYFYMNIPKLGVEKSKVSQVGNIVYDAGMNVGEAIGLVKREPWYIYWLKALGIVLVLSFLGLNILFGPYVYNSCSSEFFSK